MAWYRTRDRLKSFATEGADIAICARGEKGVREVAAALAVKGVRSFGDAVDLHSREVESIGDLRLK